MHVSEKQASQCQYIENVQRNHEISKHISGLHKNAYT